MIYRFNSTVIDSNNYTLMDDGVAVMLEPQVFDLLVYLIERRERLVSRHEILDALWPGKVVTEGALSNRIKMVRAAVGDNGHDQRVIKTVHGRGYQFVASIETSLNTNVLSHSASGLAQKVARPNKAFAYLGASLLLLMVLVVALVFFNAPRDAVNSGFEKSIAILPFENRSNQADDLYFTDGIHGDLLAQISRIQGIKSISRTSVMTYRGSDKNLQEIAEDLGVAIILEGGVQRSGNQVRINTQLIDVKTDVPIWSLTYTRELTAENIFQIQSEIASAIAHKLKAEFAMDELATKDAFPTQNLAALEWYFKARSVTEESTTRGYQKAVGYLKQAIVLDQRFTAAYIELAKIYLEQTFFEGFPRAEQLKLAYELIEKIKAIELDSSEILTIEAQYFEYANQYQIAEQKYQQAIALNPNNVLAYTNYARMQNWILADYEASIEHFETALKLDPVNLGIQQEYAIALNNGGYPIKALRTIEGVVAADSNLPLAWLSLCRIQTEAFFQYFKAIQACRQAVALDPDNPFLVGYLALIYGQLGEKEWMAKFANRAYLLGGKTHSHLGEKLYAQSRPEEALEAFYQVKKGTIFFRHSNSFVAIIGLQHDLSGAINYFTLNYPELTNTNATIDLQNIYPAYYFALLLSKNGAQAKADRLIQGGMAYIAQNQKKFALQEFPIITLYHLAAGDKNTAFAYFKQFVERGGTIGKIGFIGSMLNLVNDFPAEPSWQGEPEYERLAAEMRTRITQQRESLKNAETSGELVVIPDLNL